MPFIIFGGIIAALLMFRCARTIIWLMIAAGMVDWVCIVEGWR